MFFFFPPNVDSSGSLDISFGLFSKVTESFGEILEVV